jgi:hypothetical protein
VDQSSIIAVFPPPTPVSRNIRACLSFDAKDLHRKSSVFYSGRVVFEKHAGIPQFEDAASVNSRHAG